MITKFDSLYAGHTDLDNIGYGGTPINERSYSNAHLATALSKAESMATLVDGLGYNCFWMAEHHFQREGTECIPNTILMALHLAHRTKSIKIGRSRCLSADQLNICFTCWLRITPARPRKSTSAPA